MSDVAMTDAPSGPPVSVPSSSSASPSGSGSLAPSAPRAPRPHPPEYYAPPADDRHSTRPRYTEAQLALIRALPAESEAYAPLKREHLVTPRSGKVVAELGEVEYPPGVEPGTTIRPFVAAPSPAPLDAPSAHKSRKLSAASSAPQSFPGRLGAPGEFDREEAAGAGEALERMEGEGKGEEEEGKEGEAGGEEAGKDGAGGKKRKRGGQKTNEREIYNARLSGPQVRLCRATMMGEACKWQDRCKFSHDAAAFLAEKAEDYPGPCPIFAKFGTCESGLGCRYAREGHDAKYAPTSPPPASSPLALELNIPAKDALNAIKSCGISGRKYEAAFPRTQQFMQAYERWKKMKDALVAKKQQEKQRLQKEQNERAAAAAAAPAEPISAAAPVSASEPAPMVVDTESAPPPTAAAPAASPSPSPASASSSYAPVLGITATTLPPSFPPLTPAEEVEVAALKALYTPAVPMKLDPFQIVTAEYTDWSSGVILVDLERKRFDFRDKLYLAPLTTVGNLPFRMVCRSLGCDVTIGEMALCPSISKGQGNEWALLRRHKEEKYFGVQIAAAFVDQVARACEVINQHCTVDFVDLNCGCPIDQVTSKGMGSALMQKHRMRSLEPMMRCMNTMLDNAAATIKVRMGWSHNELTCRDILPIADRCGMAAVTIHGRTRQQRYTKSADRDFIRSAATFAKEKCHGLPIIANGDVYTFEDYESLVNPSSDVATTMIARGALVKPWIFTEIRERRHWDISAGERLDLMRRFVDYGHEHFGTDTKGIENTRRYLLEWLSFLHRYVPVGLLEVPQVGIQQKSPAFYARSDLEQLLASPEPRDWIRISEMLIGPTPDGFRFTPKHKSGINSEEGGG